LRPTTLPRQKPVRMSTCRTETAFSGMSRN
jgi:hypothetical protein